MLWKLHSTLALNNFTLSPVFLWATDIWQGSVCVCVCLPVFVCVCVPSISSWHSSHVINIHLHLRENRTWELASGGVLGILGWFGQRITCQFPLCSVVTSCIANPCLIYKQRMSQNMHMCKHISGNTNATQNTTVLPIHMFGVLFSSWSHYYNVWVIL